MVTSIHFHKYAMMVGIKSELILKVDIKSE